MSGRPVRVAVRGLLIHDDRLLLVNAWRSGSSLLCAPGGGVEKHSSLPENLIREFYEETGLTISVGDPCLINEFHEEARGFHQVDIYFRVALISGDPHQPWTDPEGVVNQRKWLTKDEVEAAFVKPDSLARVAWGEEVFYDPLEPTVR